MTRTTQRLSIETENNQTLAAIVERPGDSVQLRGVILFLHCFTCSKDLKSIVRIARGLAEAGWITMRFDFTGIGQSSGAFEETNFNTNLSDIDRVCQWMGEHEMPVNFFFGHSFGGLAATLAAAKRNAAGQDNIQGVVTLAAPSDTAHLADTLEAMNPAIAETGLGSVTIGEKQFMISAAMLENFRETNFRLSMLDARSQSSVPQLILHSLADRTVDYSHGTKLYNLLRVPTSNQRPHDISFITLTQADHLLFKNPADVAQVLQLTDQWCSSRMVARD